MSDVVWATKAHHHDESEREFKPTEEEESYESVSYNEEQDEMPYKVNEDFRTYKVNEEDPRPSACKATTTSLMSSLKNLPLHLQRLRDITTRAVDASPMESERFEFFQPVKFGPYTLHIWEQQTSTSSSARGAMAPVLRPDKGLQADDFTFEFSPPLSRSKKTKKSKQKKNNTGCALAGDEISSSLNSSYSDLSCPVHDDLPFQIDIATTSNYTDDDDGLSLPVPSFANPAPTGPHYSSTSSVNKPPAPERRHLTTNVSTDPFSDAGYRRPTWDAPADDLFGKSPAETNIWHTAAKYKSSRVSIDDDPVILPEDDGGYQDPFLAPPCAPRGASRSSNEFSRTKPFCDGSASSSPFGYQDPFEFHVPVKKPHSTRSSPFPQRLGSSSASIFASLESLPGHKGLHINFYLDGQLIDPHDEQYLANLLTRLGRGPPHQTEGTKRLPASWGLSTVKESPSKSGELAFTPEEVARIVNELSGRFGEDGSTPTMSRSAEIKKFPSSTDGTHDLAPSASVFNIDDIRKANSNPSLNVSSPIVFRIEPEQTGDVGHPLTPSFLDTL